MTTPPEPPSEGSLSDGKAAPLLLLTFAGFYLLIALWLLLRSIYGTFQSRMAGFQIYDPVDDRMSDITARRMSMLESSAPTKLLRTWWTSRQRGKTPGDNDNNFMCAICLEPVLMGNTVHPLPCMHVFHSRCIENWFVDGHNNCPLCQKHFCPHPNMIGSIV